jgi:hypothetical protein
VTIPIYKKETKFVIIREGKNFSVTKSIKEYKQIKYKRGENQHLMRYDMHFIRKDLRFTMR